MNDATLADTFGPYDTGLGAGKPSAKAWRDALIVFDTSALSMIYKVGPATRLTVLELMEEVKDQLWMPYQVGVEYHRNRLTFRKAVGTDIKLRPDRMHKAMEKILLETDKAQEDYSDLGLEADLLIMADAFKRISETIKDRPKRDDREAIDKQIYDKLKDLYSASNIGPEPSHKTRKKWIRLAQERIDAKLPPGWLDEEKPGDHKYGDYLLWFQMLEQAKEHPSDIIFVTQDLKEDWWGDQGLHTLLIEEFRRKTGQSASGADLLTFIAAANKVVESRSEEQKARADAAVMELRSYSAHQNERLAASLAPALQVYANFAASLPAVAEIGAPLLSISRTMGAALEQSGQLDNVLHALRHLQKLSRIASEEEERFEAEQGDVEDESPDADPSHD